jgi:hypothetical protein
VNFVGFCNFEGFSICRTTNSAILTTTKLVLALVDVVIAPVPDEVLNYHIYFTFIAWAPVHSRKLRLLGELYVSHAQMPTQRFWRQSS